MTTSIFQDRNETQITGVTNSFSVLKKAEMNLDFSVRRSFSGTLRGLWVFFSGATDSPTSLEIMISTDTGGDNIIIPSTASAITSGLTTGTSGSASWDINIPVILSGEVIYVFIKTDTGTVTVDKVWISWTAQS